MTSNTGIDTWNLISGAIGVLTVFPFLWAIVYNQHPETKLAHLESTLKDTECLLHSVVEEGLLHHEHHVPHFESNLTMLRSKTEALREETFIASIKWRKLLQAWFNGLSRRIDTLCKQVKAVRANICETSADARVRLRQQRLDEEMPVHRRWCARVAKFVGGILSMPLAGRTSVVEAPNPPVSIIPTIPTPQDTVSCTMDSATLALEGTACYDVSLSVPPLRRASIPPQNPSTSRVTSRAHLPRTASSTHDLHVLACVLRRVDRELSAQGVSNALLAQLVQATHRHWSPASSKAYHPRRSRKQHRPMPRPEHVIPLQRASEPGINVDSDADSSGEGDDVRGEACTALPHPGLLRHGCSWAP